jgi:uncharacterized delta-60 repeat protein
LTHPHVERLEGRTLFAAGDPDLSFGAAGIASVNFTGDPFLIADVALQPDGKLVVAGSRGVRMAVTRFNVNGTIDDTFADGGLFELSGQGYPQFVAIQSDGGIVVAITAGGTSTTVARLTAGGDLDTSFGSSGVTLTRVHSVRGMTIQQDDRVIVVGDDDDSADGDFAVSRLTAGGLPDNSFDGDGYRTVGFGNRFEIAHGVSVDYNGTPATNPFYGTIVVAGSMGDSIPPSSTRLLLCRLLPNGSLDNRFDSDGKLTSPDLSPQPFEVASGVLIQPGGRIVVTGTAIASGGGNVVGDFLLARYLPGGALDTSFGPFGNGVVQTDLGSDERAGDVALSLAGGLLVTGRSADRVAVAAYTYDGLLDARFGGGDGVLTTPLGLSNGFFDTGDSATTRDAINPGGRLVLAGARQLARYEDVASAVTLDAVRTETNEATGPTLEVFVARPDRAPVDLRVYVDMGGTATSPAFISFPPREDYNVAGITLPGFNVFRAYVDIPAGERLTSFTITPINDSRAEGDETIELSVSTDLTYVTGSPAGTTLVIRDDDLTGGPAVVSSAFVFDSGPPQRVTFRFNQNVGSSIGSNDFSVTGPAGSVPFNFAYDGTSTTATLSFTAGFLPNGNYTARAIAAGITNAGGQPMAADAALAFFALAGDINRDRSVNGTDFALLAGNFGRGGMTFAQGDLNGDGRVDGSDFAILAGNFGKSVPAAPALLVASSPPPPPIATDAKAPRQPQPAPRRRLPVAARPVRQTVGQRADLRPRLLGR